ncbi:MAG: DUF951 domain-containing protein [Clostridiales bacterium]|nr:DUF951 domain-containing protein [Clostridiales bacterium]
MPKILKFCAGDILELKKPHPCGEKLFTVLRVGSDVRIVCKGCGRDLTLPRVKLEKAVKKIHSVREDDQGSLSGKDNGK